MPKWGTATELRCPACGSDAITRVARLSVEKLASRMAAVQPYRCRGCKVRFVRVGSRPARTYLSFVPPLLLVPLVITGGVVLGRAFFRPGTPVQPRPVVITAAPPSAARPAPIPSLIRPAAGESSGSPHNPTVSPPTQPPQAPASAPAARPQASPPVAQPTTTIPTVPAVHLEADGKFRANWQATPQGLLITRLSPGPLQRAGVRIGDVLTTLDGRPLQGEKPLLQARDAIMAGRLASARLEVRRGDQVRGLEIRKQ